MSNVPSDNPIADASKEFMREHPALKAIFHEAPDLTDPLAIAEEIVGVSHDDKERGEGFRNPATALGFLLLQERSRRSNELATATGDTRFNMSIQDYKDCIEAMGFKEVLQMYFYIEDEENHHGDEAEVQAYHQKNGHVAEILSMTSLGTINSYRVRHREEFYIYWYRGILLVWDTYRGNRNGAQCYVNLKPRKNDSCLFKIPHLSGSWAYAHPHKESEETRELWNKSPTFREDYIGLCHFDAREFLKKNIQRCEREFDILPIWKKQHNHLWLLHHGDTRNKKHGEYDVDKIVSERIRLLPVEIQNAIAGTPNEGE